MSGLPYPVGMKHYDEGCTSKKHILDNVAPADLRK